MVTMKSGERYQKDWKRVTKGRSLQGRELDEEWKRDKEELRGPTGKTVTRKRVTRKRTR